VSRSDLRPSFKALADDAIDAAGLGAGAIVLDEKNRKVTLGLAVNWGMRTLLAYAAETGLRHARGPRRRRDLAWIGALVRKATTVRMRSNKPRQKAG
jgi:hypothetical protein